mgnify:FL=1
MKLYNLQHPDEQVTFAEAVKLGLGRNRGLFFPTEIPRMNDLTGLLRLPFVERSCHIIEAWIGSEIGREAARGLVEKAFDFPIKLVRVDARRSILELFHGPTLAFKDFGARFMAQCLREFAAGQQITILTATSGDTGAAVAHAFYGLPGIKVVVLYPEGKISQLQEKLFCTLGGNIHTVAVSADFDACQELVKKSFVDAELQQALHLNSANSINISRLLAQICYYFEAVAACDCSEPPVIAVPSGNFGNLTAGLLAQAMGLPVKRFIAATNCNDTVPRYLSSGVWSPNPTVATASNAMDVAAPSNWPRVEAALKAMDKPLRDLTGLSVSEDQTRESLRELHCLGYLAEPHAAVAACALQNSLQPGEQGIFLGTAHPAKFKESVEQTLALSIDLPAPLQAVSNRSVLSKRLADDFNRFKNFLLEEIAC